MRLLMDSFEAEFFNTALDYGLLEVEQHPSTTERWLSEWDNEDLTDTSSQFASKPTASKVNQIEHFRTALKTLRSNQHSRLEAQQQNASQALRELSNYEDSLTRKDKQARKDALEAILQVPFQELSIREAFTCARREHEEMEERIRKDQSRKEDNRFYSTKQSQ
ncbi:hypothetical protein SJAG_05267 [Schizosaccharomyces japonicus yFS275]|uniref:Uncharacterized protein n=1 Tax=Schizosaccharomyces japonicus (strain yFS275 / FY16936) TaxID=402676 RepID=B6K2K0_SCHJY|nr:hypothetical protein SJAG_05267 [Schizosaccharomyces japonicus yFS275]EEB07381.1 hypothetical protein SJAG_05267 [Schizosaccharomyces japonicus yFS275]